MRRVIAKVAVFALICGVTWSAIHSLRQVLAQAQDPSDPNSGVTVVYYDGVNYQDTNEYQNSVPATDYTASADPQTDQPVQTQPVATSARRSSSQGTKTKPAMSSSASIPEFQVTPIIDVLSVKATAEVYDGNAKAKYVWGLKVFDAQGEVQSSHIYSDKSFGTNGSHVRPIFADIVAMPPVGSHVVLTLYSAPENGRMDLLQDDAIGKANMVSRSHHEIEAF